MCGWHGVTYQARSDIHDVFGHEENERVHLTRDGDGKFSCRDDISYLVFTLISNDIKKCRLTICPLIVVRSIDIYVHHHGAIDDARSESLEDVEEEDACGEGGVFE